VAWRSAWSSWGSTTLELRLVDQDDLVRTEVGSPEAWQLLEQGGVTLALPFEPANGAGAGPGRPMYNEIDVGLRRALSMSVARIDLLEAIAGDADETGSAVYDEARREVLQALEPVATSLFNASRRFGRLDVQARAICEREGPLNLARSFEVPEDSLAGHLREPILAHVQMSGGYRKALGAELDLLKAISRWAQAHLLRRKGERSRTETIKDAMQRLIAAATQHGPVHMKKAPRINEGVRRNLVAHRQLGAVSDKLMVILSLLFGMEPAHGVFASRHYLVPVLAAASFAGKLALRRQDAEIADSMTALGLIAIGEMQLGVYASDGEPAKRDPDVVALQDRIRLLLNWAGHEPGDWMTPAKRFVNDGEAQLVRARPGPLRFY
jgi:hypothetical protein